MKKNKKIKSLSLGHQWRQFPQSFKNLLVILSFLILFVFPLIVAWKLYKNNHNPTLLPSASSIQTVQNPPLKEVSSLQDQSKPLTNELVQNSQASKTSQLHIQRMLLIDVISGEASSQTLKILLQKSPEPWAKNLLTKLAPIIDDIKSYPQLERLLLLSVPSKRSSFWEHIKMMFNSPYPISEMNEKEGYRTGWIGAIQKALHNRNIQNALYYFKKLSPQEQSQLSSWNKYAHRLLTFETIMKTNPIEENPEGLKEKGLRTANKLVAFALLNGIMEELFPSKALVIFLQKSPEPWAKNLLTRLTPIIHDTGSYPRLEEFLVVFNSLESDKNSIHIRKIKQSGEYENVEIEDIQKALRNHDLQKALNYYENLPPAKKELLKDWNDYAKRLQILDTEMKRLYLEITEGLE